MKIPRGKRNLDIDPGLLVKLDLATLEYTLHFRLNENPHVKVSIVSERISVQCRLSVATYYTDWPDDAGYSELFGFAVAAAASRIYKRKQDAGCKGPYVKAKGSHTIFHYQVKLPLACEGLLQKLRMEFQALMQELPAVYSLLARGPQPGSSSFDDGGSEEEGAAGNNKGEG